MLPACLPVGVNYRADYQHRNNNQSDNAHFPVFFLPHQPHQKRRKRQYKNQKENDS